MISLIAIDLGGTKSRIGLFDLADSQGTPLVQQVYLNDQFSSIEEVMGAFIKEFSVSADYACLGVAGRVENGEAQITNLPWHISEKTLAEHFSFKRVHLINDMTALAESIATLTSSDVFTLQEGEGAKGQVAAIVAPGTGMGEGYLVREGNNTIAIGSEGGHSGFSPSNNEQALLLKWMMESEDHVCVEQICSGPAIADLFRFYLDQKKLQPAGWIEKKLSQTKEFTPVIVEGAVSEENSCELCKKTIDLFLGLVGSEAANLALKLYSRGGIYIGGGVMPRLVGRVSFEPFLRGFRKKGKMADFLQAIPVNVIIKADAPLYGAAHSGRKIFKNLC